ncbi:hypothetical protein [Microbacterium sp. CPCC 204701]|uniref:hypothetical protein n=1 Tax=Microbacterium sp. CPCC 204701 TaxID=2493084 RepID=UPI000FD93A8D|nr:hypothetical protein [Microbacterium sp. CPCC 204701]
MENYLLPDIKVPFDDLFPDPNNPRLAVAEKPGYHDAEKLFDEGLRTQIMTVLGEPSFETDEVIQAVLGQGWMPIDNIITWDHPDDGLGRHVVVEGNRRLLSLYKIRTVELDKQVKKLERMEKRASTYPAEELKVQRNLVAQIRQIKADTDELTVVPIDADSADELLRKLPRILAVRHIIGAKGWGNYAEDLWLLERYEQLFEDKHGADTGRFWDAAVIRLVAGEASLTATSLKRQLKAASWFGHFKAEYEDELPEGESFSKTDYYLFELISRKPWIREQLGLGEDDRHLSPESEKVLFDWTFKMPRGRSADDNPNVFFRHENVKVWDDMHKYDQQNGTDFAANFDVAAPDTARPMAEIEAEWLSHKAKRKPQAIIDDLLKRLAELTAEKLATEGTALRVQLERLRDQSDMFIKMIDATGA